MAQLERQLDRLLAGEGQPRGVAFGVLRLLAQGEAGLLPRQLRGDEQVDVQGLRCVMEVDTIAVLGVVLHARPHAAPERVERRAELLRAAGL